MASASDRIAPSNLQAEQNALAALMKATEVAQQVKTLQSCSTLTPPYVPRTAAIFNVTLQTYMYRLIISLLQYRSIRRLDNSWWRKLKWRNRYTRGRPQCRMLPSRRTRRCTNLCLICGHSVNQSKSKVKRS